ncbi:RGS domain-containing protein [Phlyctochytrium arcticum]|nr:RGS domain-containing protein [Phlyctochytrium arcticum]
MHAAGAGTRKYKIGLTSVLNDEYESPFALADFERFVKKEHSEENLEFWHAIMRYRQTAFKLFPTLPSSLRTTRRVGSHNSIRSMSSVFASTASLTPRSNAHQTLQVNGSHSGPGADRATLHGSTEGSEDGFNQQSRGSDEHINNDGRNNSLQRTGAPGGNGGKDRVADFSQLKDEVEFITTLYMTPGSEKEVNLPAAMRKKVLVEINEKKNFHPDVFKNVLEHTYLMMKTSSYPNFYRQCCNQLLQKNLPFPARLPHRAGAHVSSQSNLDSSTSGLPPSRETQNRAGMGMQ